MPGPLSALQDPKFRSDVGGGVLDAINRGAIGSTLGAPADMANTLANLAKAGYGFAGHKLGLLSADQMPEVNDNPVGGSEWIGNKMQEMGIVSGNRNPMAEGLAAAAVPLAPRMAGGVARVARGAAAQLPVIRDGIESGMAAGGQYPEMIPPRRFRGPALEGQPNGGTVNIDGKPYNFGTDQRISDVAQKYANEAGLTYSPLTKYTPVDKTRATALAGAYDAMPHNPSDPATAKSYQALMDETQAQYAALQKAGYSFDFIKGDDPYGNPRNAIRDLVQNKKMSVFPSSDGFGGSESAGVDISNNPLLKPSELQIGDGSHTTTYNDLFRAVHDAFGHGQYGAGFRAGGEESAFQAHARMYSPDAVPAATSETRGQNSWVNYGPHGKFNQTASPSDTQYAPQKTGIMPDWTWQDGVGN